MKYELYNDVEKKLRKCSHRQPGFSCFEYVLMISLVLSIGYLAIPGYSSDPGTSRDRSEKSIHFKWLRSGAIFWYFKHSHTHPHFPSEASPNVIASGSYTNPPQKPCAGGMSDYNKNPKIWNKQPWKALKFSINQAHYTQYIYTVNNSNTKGNPSFTVTALSDLDCDGTFSTYQMTVAKGKSGELVRGPITIRNDGE
mgnify:CR=1 FL=1